MKLALFLRPALVLSLAAALSAQSAVNLGRADTTANGVVTGTVFAEDTQRPVRFAEVQLDPASVGDGRSRGGGSVRVRTDVNGAFTASAPAGDYYVTASAVGYVPMRELLLARINAGADPAQLLHTLAQVHIGTGSASDVRLSLERGAAISGHLQWEDGSPAAGVQVYANHAGSWPTQLPAPLPQLSTFGNRAATLSDDRGNFRIAGLAGGDYVVMAIVQSGFQPGGPFAALGNAPRVRNETTISFFAPGVLHAASAETYKLRPPEEHTDVRLTLDLRNLHSVSGAAVSASPNLSVASGNVTLTDTSDANLNLRGSIEPDGTFTVPFVPAGNYNLQIQNASTQANGPRGRDSSSSATRFQPLAQTVIVTDRDLTGVALSLTPVTTH